jgi:hypothetical protein
MLTFLFSSISLEKYGLIFISSLLMWVAPVYPLLLLILASVFLDTIFGIWASIKLGKPIISRKLERIIIKCGLYSASFLLFYGVDHLILNDVLFPKLNINLFLSKLVAISFILIELFSIDEKIRLVNNNKGIGHYLECLYKKAIVFKKRITKLLEKNETN